MKNASLSLAYCRGPSKPVKYTASSKCNLWELNCKFADCCWLELPSIFRKSSIHALCDDRRRFGCNEWSLFTGASSCCIVVTCDRLKTDRSKKKREFVNLWDWVMKGIYNSIISIASINTHAMNGWLLFNRKKTKESQANPAKKKLDLCS